jgi:uncharacterized membrane protein
MNIEKFKDLIKNDQIINGTIIITFLGLTVLYFFKIKTSAEYLILLWTALLFLINIVLFNNYIYLQTNKKVFLHTFSISFLLILFMEAIGIKAGMIFSPDILIFEIISILIISLNWSLIIFGSYYLSQKIVRQKWGKIILSAIIITFFDFVFEPVASKLYLGHWYNQRGIILNNIPIQVYIAWFVIGIIISLILNRQKIILNSGTILYYLFSQLFFYQIIQISLFK